MIFACTYLLRMVHVPFTHTYVCVKGTCMHMVCGAVLHMYVHTYVRCMYVCMCAGSLFSN